MTRNCRRSVETIRSRFGLSFDLVRTREDGTTKPSAEPVLDICRIFRVTPGRAVVVGDYLFDIQAGRSAGAMTVLFSPEPQPPAYASLADRVIRRLPELLDIIDRLRPGRAADAGQARTRAVEKGS